MKKISRAISAARKIHEFDATGLSIGRLASQIAKILQGKHLPSYTPNIDGGEVVCVTHAAKVKITGSKVVQKQYFHYSGYPGGMKVKDLKEVMQKDPADALRRSVKSMLPKNRLLKDRLKRLTITN